MFRRLFGRFVRSDSPVQPVQTEQVQEPQEAPFTLDQIKEQILAMNSGEKKSFPIDQIPEDQEFDNFTGWIVLNKGAAFIGRDYKRMRLDISLF